MKRRAILSLKKTLIISAICVVAFLLATVYMNVTGIDSPAIILMNPFISGFIHVSIEHFVGNMLGLFLFLIPAVNAGYRVKEIFWITFLISIAYLPISILGLTDPAVGISGTCMFLTSRSLLSIKNKKIGIVLVSLIALSEMLPLFDADGTAHGVHLLGLLLGYLSLKSGVMEKIFPKFITSRIACPTFN